MSITPAIKVGILVFMAAIMFFGAYMFLNAHLRNSYGLMVSFDDAMGMTEGSPVRMSGVTIGSVSKISLSDDLRADMELRINEKYLIPTDSEFVMRVGMFIGEKSIDVVPNRRTRKIIKADSMITGVTASRMEDLIPKAEKLLTTFSHKSDVILAKTEDVVTNLADASKDIKRLLGNGKLQAQMDRTFQHVESTTSILEETLSEVKGIVITNEDDLRSILRNTDQASRSFRDAAKGLADFTQDRNMRSELSETMVSARKASESLSRSMASLERSLTSLESLTTSPEMHQNIEGTVAGARKAVDETNKILGKVGGLFRTRKGGRSILPALPKSDTTIDSIYRPNDGRFRTSLTTSLRFGNRKHLDLGIYDLGGENKIILQAGRKLNASNDLRLGIYASKLGIGLDHDFSKRLVGSLDMYDPNNPTTDLRMRYRINDDWGLLFGVDKVFDDNQFTLGVRLQK